MHSSVTREYQFRQLPYNVQEVIRRARTMLTGFGKPYTGKQGLFVRTGIFGADIAGDAGVLRIGAVGSYPPYVAFLNEDRVVINERVSDDLVEKMLEEFRRAMILEDLAHA